MLTAKEWLDKENIIVPEIKWGESEIKFHTIENLMEKYANYKNKELEDKIIQFREFLTNEITLKASTNLHSLNVVDYYKKLIEERDKTYLKEYDEHFNLK
jgi:hypothetical protein